jgi:hypothetical protein
MAIPCLKQLYKGTSNEFVIRQKWKDSLDSEVVMYTYLVFKLQISVHFYASYRVPNRGHLKALQNLFRNACTVATACKAM